MPEREELDVKLRRFRAHMGELNLECRENERRSSSVFFDLFRHGTYVCSAQIEDRMDFIEFSWSMEFPSQLQTWLSGIFFQVMERCYDHGIYFTIDHSKKFLRLILCTKLYFSAIHYYALIEVLRDLEDCVGEVGVLFSNPPHHDRGEHHGNQKSDGRQGHSGSQ